MSQRINEFKEFVKANPIIKNIMDSQNKTWQQLFEEWTMFGPMDFLNNYDKNKDNITKEANTIQSSKEPSQLGDMVKTCIDYVKKINPDNVTKTISNIQKLMALVAGAGVSNTVGAVANRKTGDPLFDRRFDEWY